MKRALIILILIFLPFSCRGHELFNDSTLIEHPHSHSSMRKLSNETAGVDTDWFDSVGQSLQRSKEQAHPPLTIADTLVDTSFMVYAYHKSTRDFPICDTALTLFYDTVFCYDTTITTGDLVYLTKEQQILLETLFKFMRGRLKETGRIIVDSLLPEAQDE